MSEASSPPSISMVGHSGVVVMISMSSPITRAVSSTFVPVMVGFQANAWRCLDGLLRLRVRHPLARAVADRASLVVLQFLARGTRRGICVGGDGRIQRGRGHARARRRRAAGRIPTPSPASASARSSGGAEATMRDSETTRPSRSAHIATMTTCRHASRWERDGGSGAVDRPSPPARRSAWRGCWRRAGHDCARSSRSSSPGSSVRQRSPRAVPHRVPARDSVRSRRR